ncbi:MAG: hypothetical protein F6K63_02100 [Moorea sp. SIO1G6]|uniref:hypothetical protein n=1 Tax=Moorena sp. SIO1G6 TaxID=2607840 RepID=UPI0013C0C542|nr:hypothetical protein [Moorena sp. SIO1G6]NET63254.1 hypothetical protein [Moorena sp. SIO1G6]
MGRWGDGDLTWVGFLHLGEYVLALGINFSKYVGKSTRISTDYRPISPLAITDYPLPISHYPLPITYYLLPITYYLLPITYYLLPITYYLSPK